VSPEETAGSVEMVLGMCGLVGPRCRGQFTQGHGCLGRRCGLLSNYLDLLLIDVGDSAVMSMRQRRLNKIENRTVGVRPT